MDRSDFVGLEFDWFAKDANGCLALFSSAGWGPVPDVVFNHYDDQAQIGRCLSAVCGIRESDDLNRSSQALLQRGIFAYDWHETFGPYVRFGAPTTPACVVDLALPPELQQALVPLPNHNFRHSAELHESDLPSFTDVRRRAGNA
jgi:hypothetical protein